MTEYEQDVRNHWWRGSAVYVGAIIGFIMLEVFLGRNIGWWEYLIFPIVYVTGYLWLFYPNHKKYNYAWNVDGTASPTTRIRDGVRKPTSLLPLPIPKEWKKATEEHRNENPTVKDLQKGLDD